MWHILDCIPPQLGGYMHGLWERLQTPKTMMETYSIQCIESTVKWHTLSETRALLAYFLG